MGNIPRNWINKQDAQKYLRCVICDYCEMAPSNYVDVSGYSEDPREQDYGQHFNDPGIRRRVILDKRSGDPVCSQCRREARDAVHEQWFMDGGDWSTLSLDADIFAHIPLDKEDNQDHTKMRIEPPPVKDDDYYAPRLKEIELQRKTS